MNVKCSIKRIDILNLFSKLISYKIGNFSKEFIFAFLIVTFQSKALWNFDHMIHQNQASKLEIKWKHSTESKGTLYPHLPNNPEQVNGWFIDLICFVCRYRKLSLLKLQ